MLIPAFAQADSSKSKHLKGGLKMIRRDWMAATMIFSWRASPLRRLKSLLLTDAGKRR